MSIRYIMRILLALTLLLSSTLHASEDYLETTMTFKYTKEWENELLKMYKALDEGADWDDRIDDLIEMGEYSNDARVVQALIRCLAIQLDGMDESVETILGGIDHDIYYEGVFQIVSEYFEFKTDKNHADYFAMQILHRGYTDKPPEYESYSPSKDEVENIFTPIAMKYLSIDEMQQFVSIMENNGCPEDEDDCDEPQVFFYESFKKAVMEE